MDLGGVGEPADDGHAGEVGVGGCGEGAGERAEEGEGEGGAEGG